MPCTFIIAAPHSGSGKTTLTLGIMACLERRGLRVAPFKVGPDFIDPGYHRLITGRPSINLDGWICPEEFVRATFVHHASTADVAVIEGVMGLFDGIGAVAVAGSTGEVAALLKAPVILVVDAKGQARSVAALVRGFADFDPQVRVAGVVFNNVASDNHAAILKSAVAHSSPDIKVLGAIPRDERLRIPSRHLGLVTADDNPLPAEFVTHLAEVVERHLDLDGLLVLGENQGWQGENQRCQENRGCQAYTFDTSVKCVGLTPIRIAVARDAAFCFVYEDNLRLLREAGAEIVVFSPLADERLPEAIAGIYLPGGYPELFAERLAANGAMKAAIRRAVDEGMPVYAECGGFIYLTKGMTPHPAPDAREGEEFVGIFPVTTRLLPKRKALGYREVAVQAGSIIGPLGTVARGHEFHYSEMAEMPATVERLFRVSREGKELGLEGYRHKNSLASYVHLHFGSNPELARSFVASCRKFQVR